MDKKFIDKVMTQVKCGVCGQEYEASGIRVVGHQDGLWFVHVICTSCRSQGLIAIAIKQENPHQIITDLTEPEYDRFMEGEGIEVR